jgi:Phosphotransferase system, galactitol-specific IIB component
MCASGVGTSELLKVKVKKYFPQLNIIDVVSLRQYENNQKEFNQVIDLIITTIGYKSKNDEKPVILVNAMFTPNDQARVEKLLKELEKVGN